MDRARLTPALAALLGLAQGCDPILSTFTQKGTPDEPWTFPTDTVDTGVGPCLDATTSPCLETTTGPCLVPPLDSSIDSADSGPIDSSVDTGLESGDTGPSWTGGRDTGGSTGDTGAGWTAEVRARVLGSGRLPADVVKRLRGPR